MRHRSDDRCALAFYGPLLHRGDVVSDLRRRNDFSAAVGHHLHGRGLLVYEVCANRDVCIHRNFGGRLLLRMAEASIGVGVNERMKDEGGRMKLSFPESASMLQSSSFHPSSFILHPSSLNLWLNTIRDSS